MQQHVKEDLAAAQEYWIGDPTRKHAGHIHMSLYLDAAAEPWDEWYAFGFPKPERKVYQSMDGYDALDLGDLYSNIMHLKNSVWDKLLFPTILVLNFIVSWESKLLTMAVMVWWWIACFFPWIFLPSLPLIFASLIAMLRQPFWREAMLAHESSLPLTYAGFVKVVGWKDSSRVAAWLKRFIEEDMLMRVKDEEQLRTFAALSFRIGRPVPGLRSLGDLRKELKRQLWVKPKVIKELKAWERGLVENTENLLGIHHVEEEEETGEKVPAWCNIPTMFVPATLQYWIRKYQDKVADIRIRVCHALDVLAEIVEHDNGGKAACLFYMACVAISMALLAISYFSYSVRGTKIQMQRGFVEIDTDLTRFAIFVLFLVGGTTLLLCGSPKTQYFRNVFTAEMYYREYMTRREDDLHKRWAFFTQDSDSDATLV